MYGVGNSSDAITRDINSLLYSSPFKHPADGEFAKIKHLLSLDPYHHPNQHQRDDTHQASLLRYRSSPSSFFSNLLNDNEGEEFPDPVTASSNHESDAHDFLQYSSSSSTLTKQERKEAAAQNQDPSPPSKPACNNTSYTYTNRNTLDSTASNLIRQTSSPDGFLSCLTLENGFTAIKDARKGGSSTTLNNNISFSLGPSSSSRFLPQIAENENGLHDSTFSSLKRSRDGGMKMSQNGEAGNHTPSLVHQMSLPKTYSEKAAVENFLHFQQESSVPWKARAKRGFATHPRSIAERERRTRISERIKRLQDLFPDMDKQTNTADMLDMAVEFIKDLQKELKTLNDAKARCRCSSKQLQPDSTM